MEQELTYEKVLDLIARQAEAQTRQMEAQTRQLEAQAKAQAKADAEARKRQAKQMEAQAKADAEARKRQEESMKDFDERLQKSGEEFNKRMKDLDRRIGGVSDTLGEFAEEQVRPKAIEMFAQRGIHLNRAIPHFRLEDVQGYAIYEVDLLLLNTTHSVAIETKNTLRQKDVEEHLERLEKIKRDPAPFVKGKSLIGAVAGMAMTKEVEDFAMKNGLFVIRPKGDSVAIINSPSFQPKTWEIR